MNLDVFIGRVITVVFATLGASGPARRGIAVDSVNLKITILSLKITIHRLNSFSAFHSWLRDRSPVGDSLSPC